MGRIFEQSTKEMPTKFLLSKHYGKKVTLETKKQMLQTHAHVKFALACEVGLSCFDPVVDFCNDGDKQLGSITFGSSSNRSINVNCT
jgi:hypothetical protein